MNKVICGGFNVGRGLRANGKVLELLGKIPQITDEDEGKVLGVKDGQLAWIEGTAEEKLGTVFTALEANSTIGFEKHNLTPPTGFNLQYSLNNGAWVDYDTTNLPTITLPNAGDKITFRGNNDYFYEKLSTAIVDIQFVLNGKWKASGDVTYLLSYDGNVDTLQDNCFRQIFNNQSALVSASELVIPSTVYGKNSCDRMFAYTDIVETPVIQATTINDEGCKQMFLGCSKLVKACELPCTDIKKGAYDGMFQLCTVLTEICSVLPMLEVPENAYYMMFEKSGITETPVIEGTKMGKQSAKRMFYQCPNLVKANKITSTTGLGSGFLNGYTDMFNGCSNLNEITVGFTSWGTAMTSTWVTGVASTGTFYCPSALTKTFGNNNIPTGWTVVNI